MREVQNANPSSALLIVCVPRWEWSNQIIVAAQGGFSRAMRPLSVPAASSITASIGVGFAGGDGFSSGRGPVPPASSLERRRRRRFPSSCHSARPDEHRGRCIAAARRIDVGASADAIVVEHDGAHRQDAAADRLDLCAREAERAVALGLEGPACRWSARRPPRAPCRCP